MDKREFLEKFEDIKKQYETSGASGGSCWGDTAGYYETGKSFDGYKDVEQNVLELLEELNIDFSFMKYYKLGKLLNDFVTSEDYYEHGYYGNFERGYYACLSMSDLYDALTEVGIL